MSQPRGSIGVSITVAVLIVIAVTSIGYYQFVYCPTASCTTAAETTSSAPTVACAPPKCLTIVINPGAATQTTTAYSPDVIRLVIGVNNTFQVLNNDSVGGGVPHSLTSRNMTGNKPVFDTGVFLYNATYGPITITQPGTYPYYCVVHPSTMIGTVVVVAGSGGNGGGGGGGGAASSTTSTTATTTTTSSSSGGTTTKSSSSATPANAFPISIPKGAGGNFSLGSKSLISGYAPGNATLVIGVNNTVTWTNDDTSAHTVTSTSVPNGVATFNSGILSAGQSWTMTFTVPGTYTYVCSLHSWMRAEIIVKSG